MLKKFTLRKLSIAILMAIVAFILYMFPEPLKEHIEDMQNNKEAIFLIDKNNYVSMIKVVNNGKDTKMIKLFLMALKLLFLKILLYSIIH